MSAAKLARQRYEEALKARTAGEFTLVLNVLMGVKQCHLHHPPVISIFVGGMATIPKWVVYGIVLPTC